MQTSNHNSNLSGGQPTIIQVAKNNTTATLIQNGQHLLIGKLEQSNINMSMENQSGNTSNNNMSNIYPLQYIETAVANANSNQNNSDGINTTAYGSGQKIFYQDSNHGGIYTSMSGQTATIIPASSIQARDLSGQLGAAVGSALHIQTTPHAQIVHHGGNAYLVQSTTRLEEESPNMSHTTKASPVTVQWLCDNYETAEGVSLPRSTLYNHYLQHCQQEKLEPMNQASFGKLIRSVFFGLRTRRLGTRGNSKYHYYGIRIKPNSVLNHYVEDQTFAMRQYPSFHRQSTESDLHWRPRYGTSNVSYSGDVVRSSGGTLAVASMDCSTNLHSSFLGESSSALPNLSEVMTRAGLDSLTSEECAAEDVSAEDVAVFCRLYLEHSDAVLSAVVYLNFKFIESLWQDFWRTSNKAASPLEEKLPKARLGRLLRLPQVQAFLQFFDNVFYQSLVEVLIPNVLRPIPSALTQNIRHFAKSLESWMATATAGLHSAVVRVKMSCVCALAQTLRRHTSLNHLAQAARAVLKNAGQISQMLTDLNRVDFSNVQEQASWVCGCDGKRVDALQQDFKRILQQQASLEDWAAWLDGVVTDVLAPVKATPQYPHAAHQFILKWSFYSSMVIRDLTLRSAASFGSFHLIRLLYDEYIYYLVEQKVADHLNLTPVAVTGEMGRQLMATGHGDYGHLNTEADDPLPISKSKFKTELLGGKDADGCGGASVAAPSIVRVVSVSGGAADSEFRMLSTNSNPLDSNQSSYNNSIAMADEQVDESADDDEGLDEEESQMQEQLVASGNGGSTGGADGGGRILSATSVTRSMLNTTMMVQKMEAAPSSALTTGCHGSGSGARAVPVLVGNAAAARKTVNVTTFGDPQPLPSSDQSVALTATTTTTSTTAMTTAVSSSVTNSNSNKVNVLFSSSSSLLTVANQRPVKAASSINNESSSSSSSSSVAPTKRIKLLSNCPMTTSVSGPTAL